jgi:hypothetical protein
LTPRAERAGAPGSTRLASKISAASCSSTRRTDP